MPATPPDGARSDTAAPEATLVVASQDQGLTDLLEELQLRLTDARTARGRLQALLRAVLAVGGELELQGLLRRLTEAAADLADARYAALGVLGEDGAVAQFLAIGVDEAAMARIGSFPRGEGLLGKLVEDPRPLRLDDMARHPAAVGFPAGHPPMTTFLGVPIRVRGQVFGNLYLTEKRDGARFDDEDEAIVIALASAAGVAIENARLYEAARRRQGWLQAAADVSNHLLSGDDPEDVLALVCRRARELTGAQTALLALPAGSCRLLVEASHGTGAQDLLGVSLSPTAPDGVGSGALDPRLVERLAALGLGRALHVPVGSSGERSGALVVAYADGAAPPSSAVVAELTAFASQAAVALELAQRRRESEQLVVYEDRDRIARDLHDLVIQRLFATGMALEGASRLVQPPEAAARVHKAVDDLDMTIREIRSTIYGLQTSVEHTPSLRARVLVVVDAGADQLGFPPDVQLSGLVDTAVPADVGEQLLAALREALSNAARHACAGAVRVRVDVTERALRLVVSDDGVGIPPGDGRRSGLANLEERASQLGGRSAAGPGAHGGTEVVWEVPLAALPPQRRQVQALHGRR